MERLPFAGWLVMVNALAMYWYGISVYDYQDEIDYQSLYNREYSTREAARHTWRTTQQQKGENQ